SANLTKGTLSGDIAVPPFTARVVVLGIPTNVSLTLTEASPISGTIGIDPNNASNLKVAATSKVTLGIDMLGVAGINIRTHCQTISPVTFPLNASVPALDLTMGTTFTGNVNLPPVICGGILGPTLTAALTTLFSGPANPFSLTIAPPTT